MMMHLCFGVYVVLYGSYKAPNIIAEETEILHGFIAGACTVHVHVAAGQLQQPLQAMPDAASCNSRYKQCLMQRIEGETELHVCSSMGRNSYEAMASTVSVGMQMRMDVWISQQ